MTSEGDALSQARTELSKLESKLAGISDPDIRSVLELRIRQIREEHPGVDLPEASPEVAVVDEPEPAPVDPEVITPPTAAQLAEADQLIRLAQVEKMRGNRQRSWEILKQAADAAPTAPAVLEALGDDAMDRKQYKDALAAYTRAMKVSQGNVTLERKHAEAVLRTSTAMSIEEQLRLGNMDAALLTPQDAIAGKTAATFFNVFFPGVGQLVLGQTQKGIILMVAWVLCLAGIVVLRNDLQQTIRMISGQRASPTLLVLIPIFFAFVVYFISLADLRGKEARHKADRPAPPVNLPFD